MYEGVIIDVEGVLAVESAGTRNCELVVDVSACSQLYEVVIEQHFVTEEGLITVEEGLNKRKLVLVEGVAT